MLAAGMALTLNFFSGKAADSSNYSRKKRLDQCIAYPGAKHSLLGKATYLCLNHVMPLGEG